MARPTKKHAEYWQSRMDDIYRYVDKNDVNMFKRIADAYNRNAKDVQNEIFRFYGKYAEDEGITLNQAKQRLRGEDFSDYQENARRYFEDAEDNPELLQRLDEQYKAAQVTRLEALHLDLEYHVGIMNGSLQGTFQQYLMNTAGYAYRKIIGGRSSSTLNQPALEEIVNRPWNGYNYSEDLWGNTDNLVESLKETFEKGFIRGAGVREMATEIRNDYSVAQHRADTLIRTEGSNIVTNATAKRYQDAGLRYYRNHVKVDNRTSDICLTVDEEDIKYSFDDYEPGETAPPFHYNCRTGIIPDEEELMEVDI